MEDLDKLRKQIDALDTEILNAFEKRQQVSEQIAAYKEAKHLPITDKTREEEKLQKIESRVSDENKVHARLLYRLIMELSKDRQRKALGLSGTSLEEIEKALEAIDKENN